MNPEDVWDTFAAKYGADVALSKLGARPAAEAAPTGWANRDANAPQPAAPSDPGTIWDGFAAHYGQDVAAQKLGPRPGAYTPPPNYLPPSVSDAPTYTPAGARTAASLALGAGSLMLPGLGPLGNILAGGAVGAGMGAVGAEPGHRMDAAKTGLMLGLAGGTVGEAGGAVINALRAPGRILALAPQVSELSGQIAAKSGALEQALKEARANTEAGYAQNTAVNKGLTDAAVQQAGSEADRAIAQRASMAGPGAARQIRDITTTPFAKDYTVAFAKQGLDAAATRYYRPLDQAFTNVQDPELLAFLKSPVMKKQTAAEIGMGAVNGTKPISFSDVQAVRSRLWNKDPGLAKQLTGLMEKTFGDPLVQADAGFKGFNEYLRGTNGVSINTPSADLAIRASTASPEHLQGMRDAFVEDLTQKLRQKDSGGTALTNFVGGGPEMQSRMEVLFTPDQVDQIRAIQQDAKDAAAAINSAANKKIGDLRVGGAFKQTRLDAGRQNILGQLDQQYGQPISDLGLLGQKLAAAEAKRQALAQVAQRSATMLKRALKIGAVAGAYETMKQVVP